MCALSVCLFYYACSADCHGCYWALLVRASPLIFGSFQFLAMFCFGCRGAFSSFSCVFTIHQRTRGNAPQCGFILELQTHSQWFYLSVCCVLMDLLPLLVGKSGPWWILTDMSPFSNAESHNQNICVRMFALWPAACTQGVKMIVFLVYRHYHYRICGFPSCPRNSHIHISYSLW